MLISSSSSLKLGGYTLNYNATANASRIFSQSYQFSSLHSPFPLVKGSTFHALTGTLRFRTSTIRFVRMAVVEGKDGDMISTGTSRSREELNKGIAELYDESSGIWEDIWGDHMHHGYYHPSQSASITEHRAAQIRMIEEALRFAGFSGSFILSFFLLILILLIIVVFINRFHLISFHYCSSYSYSEYSYC